MSQRAPRTTLYIVAALVVIVGLTATGLWLAGPGAKPASSAAVLPQSAIEAAVTVQEAFTAIADALKPSVVNINTEQVVKTQPQQIPPDLLKQFREFFGPEFAPPEPQEGVRHSLGSGVIIDSDGYILTNRHVVGGADRVDVQLANEETYPAKVLATDQYTDLAVIKINAGKPLKAAALGDATQAKVGAWAIAIGSPFGQQGTVTVGVVSATNRQVEVPGMRGRNYRNLIQTDAPINPGNSGGPLVNIHGEVIGINQQIISPIPASAGLGLAIPIDDSTKSVIASLKGGKVPERGLLGVSISDVTPAITAEYGVKAGAFVGQVMPGQAGDKAGIKAEDTIIRFGDVAIDKSDDLVGAVTRTRPGTKVDVTIVRDGKEMTVKVTVGRMEEGQVRVAKAEKAKLGLTVADLTDALIQQYHLGDLGKTKGVVVTHADPAGDAARAEIQEGDVILKISRKPTESVEAYDRAASSLKAGGSAVIIIWRQGQIFPVSVSRIGE